MNIDIPASAINKIYHQAVFNESRYQLYYGGAGSGKSVFCAQKIILNMLTAQQMNILVVRKIAKTNRYSTFAQLVNQIYSMNLTKLFKINVSDLSISCKQMGNKLICLGLDDVQKVKSITGIRMIWVEQASQITQQDFTQLNLRLRGRIKIEQRGKPYQILMSFNPVTQTHWIKKYFFDQTVPNTMIIHSTYLDNAYIDDQYADTLNALKQTNPEFYNIYCLGHWGSLGQLVFSNWDVTSFNIENVLINSKYIRIGQDWGYNDPNVSLLVTLLDNELYICKQIYVTKSLPRDIIKLLTQQSMHMHDVVADSASPQKIAQFRQSGINCTAAKKQKGSIIAGIQYLQGKKIHIHQSCVHTIKEFQSYSWKHDRISNTYYDTPVPFNDHCIDALRYATIQARNMQISPKQGIVNYFN